MEKIVLPTSVSAPNTWCTRRATLAILGDFDTWDATRRSGLASRDPQQQGHERGTRGASLSCFPSRDSCPPRTRRRMRRRQQRGRRFLSRACAKIRRGTNLRSRLWARGPVRRRPALPIRPATRSLATCIQRRCCHGCMHLMHSPARTREVSRWTRQRRGHCRRCRWPCRWDSDGLPPRARRMSFCTRHRLATVDCGARARQPTGRQHRRPCACRKT